LKASCYLYLGSGSELVSFAQPHTFSTFLTYNPLRLASGFFFAFPVFGSFIPVFCFLPLFYVYRTRYRRDGHLLVGLGLLGELGSVYIYVYGGVLWGTFGF